MAGDLMDLPSALLLIADSTLRTHTPSVVIEVSEVDILRLAEDYPEIGRALWFDTLVDASIFREWSLNLGRRNGRQRVAHLLMEIGYRLEDAMLGSKSDFPLMITQTDMADAVGLTAVHVNRSIQWLRGQGYIATRKGHVVIPDWDNLADFCAFRLLYLHTEGLRTLPN
jgi:CRP-like cAMP-binding protein